jgi:hypothetical protein
MCDSGNVSDLQFFSSLIFFVDPKGYIQDIRQTNEKLRWSHRTLKLTTGNHQHISLAQHHKEIEEAEPCGLFLGSRDIAAELEESRLLSFRGSSLIRTAKLGGCIVFRSAPRVTDLALEEISNPSWERSMCYGLTISGERGGDRNNRYRRILLWSRDWLGNTFTRTAFLSNRRAY